MAGTDQTSRRRYRGRTPEQRDAERRGRLLDAALELFGIRGWNGSSIEELCREARVTTRNFYELYSGREDLFLALYDELVVQLLAEVADAVAGSGSERDAQLRAGLGATVAAYSRDARIARVLLIEVHGISRRVEQHRRQAIDRFAELAAAVLARRADQDEGEVAHLVGVALVGAATELLVHRVAHGHGPSDDLIVDELVRIFSAAESGGGAARR